MAAPTSTQSPLRFPLPEPASPPAGRGLVPLAGTTPPGGRALVPTGGGGMPPGKAMVPYQPPGAPSTAAAAPPAATSSLRSAVNTGGGRMGSFVRGALPVAAIGGAVDSFSDMNTGYRDRFNESVGATGPVSSVLGDAARVMSNVGDAITFGLGGRLGRGISAATSGGSFSEGFMSESDRDRFNRQQMERVMGQPASTAAPTITMDQAFEQLRRGNAPGGGFEYQARFSGPTHSVFSRANPNNPGGTDPTVSKNEYIGVGAPEDPAVVAARAEQQARQSMLRQLTSAMGNSGNGGAAPAPRSNAYAINKRFDQLAERFGNMYGPRGQGNLARRLLELESQRASALANDAQIQSGLRGQDINAASNAANTRADMLRTAVDMMNNDAQIRASALASQPKPVTPAEAEKASRAAAETGMNNLREMAKSRFPDDPAKAEAAIAYMQSAPTELFGDLWSEDATARAASFEDMLKRFELSDYLNAGQNRILGNESSAYDGIAEERDVKIEDLWNGGMHPIDWAQAMSPIGLSGHSRVLRTDAGRVVQKNEMPDDLAYQKVISDEIRAAPTRRALRDANRR